METYNHETSQYGNKKRDKKVISLGMRRKPTFTDDYLPTKNVNIEIESRETSKYRFLV